MKKKKKCEASSCGYINHIDSELRRQSRCVIGCPSNTCQMDPSDHPLTLHSIFVLVSSRHESLPQRYFSPPSFFPTRRKSLSGTPWIKIAGAISRTHDIGENATEALIMVDTRRAVAATTFYPLTQDSHYTNVPPIIGPQSEVPPPASPGEPSPRVSQSLQSESCKPTRKSNSSTRRDYTREDAISISVKRDRRIPQVNCKSARDSDPFLPGGSNLPFSFNRSSDTD